MHIVTKFEISINIFTVVKLENKTPAFKKLGKMAFFATFQSKISQ